MRIRSLSADDSSHSSTSTAVLLPIDSDRLNRSRERNREHARKTRMKKKENLKNLQKKMRVLQAQGLLLKQNIEDCATASLLLSLDNKKHATGDGCHVIPGLPPTPSLGPSSPPSPPSIAETLHEVLQMTARTKPLPDDVVDDLTSEYGSRKRRRIVSGADELDHVQQRLASIQSEQRITDALDRFASTMNRSNINWKTGMYCDSNGTQKRLSVPELEKLRRERNRMHAKMTRDRKKIFVASIKQAVEKLESDNQLLRDTLSKQSDLAQYVAEQERLLLSTVNIETFEVSDEESDESFQGAGNPFQETCQSFPTMLSAVSSSSSPVTTP